MLSSSGSARKYAMGEKAALDVAKAQMVSPDPDGLAMRLKVSAGFKNLPDPIRKASRPIN